jgi:hypothetical protein
MSKRVTRVSIRLPVELMARVKRDADQCGLTARELVGQVLHGALAERLCVHRASATTASPEAEDASPA